MQPPEFASTVGLPAQAPDLAHVDPSSVVRMPPMPQPPNRRPMWIALFAGAILVALSLGIAIGRGTTDEPVEAVAVTSERGKLKVISTPKDSNVILDGRFVGVAPLENLDVDPGKHTIVVDVFGYEPYSGTVEVEARSNAKLTVVLGALNATEQTTGTVTGRGTLSRLTVPRSALMPTVPASPPAGPVSRPAQQRTPQQPVTIDQPPPPQRPRRNCSGEHSTCRDGCSRADGDCRFSCPGCVSCNSSVGWDECKRQCDTCRSGCEQNKKFCESSCSSQQTSCEASNNY